jgi:hypothetical protein
MASLGSKQAQEIGIIDGASPRGIPKVAFVVSVSHRSIVLRIAQINDKNALVIDLVNWHEALLKERHAICL